MAIKLDISPALIVVYCTDCGHWRAAAWTRAEAHERAVAHEELVHPGQRQAFFAQSKFLLRHAAETTNVHNPADSRLHGNSGEARTRA